MTTSAAAVQQRAPDLERRRVEGDVRGRWAIRSAGPRRDVVASRRPAARRRRVRDRRPPWAGRSSPRCRSRRRGSSGAQLSDGRGRRPRSAPALCQRQLRPGQHHRHAPESSSIAGQALRRVGGIERHVGAAGLEHRRAGRRSAPASARGRRPPGAPAPRPSLRRWRASRFGPRGRARRRSGPRRRSRAGGARRPRGLAPRTARDGRLARIRRRRCRSSRQRAAARSAASSSGRSERRPAGSGGDRRRSRSLEAAAPAGRPWRGVEQVGVVLAAPPAAPPRSRPE